MLKKCEMSLFANMMVMTKLNEPDSLTGLETKFENFSVENGGSIEDTYNRFLQIQNEFIELGQPLSNNKIVGKLLRTMRRKPK